MDTEDRDHFKTIANQSAGRRDDSQRPREAENLASVQFQAYCLERTMILFACYRKDEAHDAELYCAAVASTLACYDRAVVDHVTDPRSGMASEMKFLPAVAEVRTFCNEAAARMKLHAKRERLVVVPFVPPPIKPGQVDYAGFLKLAEDGKTKGRPVGPFETAEDEWNRNVAFGIAKERDDKQGFIDANQRWLNRECAEEGVNSSFETVSPSLRALLAKQDAERLDV